MTSPPTPSGDAGPETTSGQAGQAATRRGSDPDGIWAKRERNVLRKLEDALNLKEYAIRNYSPSVDDDLLSRLDEVTARVRQAYDAHTPGSNRSSALLAESPELDKLVRDFARLIHPMTAIALSRSRPYWTEPLNRSQLWWFWLILVVASVVGITTAIVAFSYPVRNSLQNALIAAALGLLGSAMHLLVNTDEVRQQRAVVAADRQTAFIRMLLGILTGWVFYFAFAQAPLMADPTTDPSVANKLMLLLPFLAGFSTKFVIGIITKALDAVDFTLGINDMRARPPEPRNRGESSHPNQI